MRVTEIDQGISYADLLPDFRSKLIAQFEAAENQVQADDCQRLLLFVLQVEAPCEQRVVHSYAQSKVMLNLETCRRRDLELGRAGSQTISPCRRLSEQESRKQ